MLRSALVCLELINMIKSRPIELTTNQINNPNYVIGICKCPVLLNYGHLFNKKDFLPNTFINFYCIECKEKLRIWNGVN